MAGLTVSIGRNFPYLRRHLQNMQLASTKARASLVEASIKELPNKLN